MSNDEAYENTAHIPGGDAFAARWRDEGQAFRDMLGPRAELGIAYGLGRRQAFDLFHPEGTATGVMIFVHGGYWRRFDRSQWSSFAAGALAHGHAVAMPSYTLAPEARISRITREVVEAVHVIADRTEGPITLVGHSAGGHLVARMLCADAMLPSAVAGRLRACVPVSPVADLRPLIDTAMNDDFRLTKAEARVESPALQAKALDVPVTVWVGACERPAFIEQARWLAAAWGAELVIEPERHHFDVIDGLRDADSPLMRAILG